MHQKLPHSVILPALFTQKAISDRTFRQCKQNNTRNTGATNTHESEKGRRSCRDEEGSGEGLLTLTKAVAVEPVEPVVQQAVALAYLQSNITSYNTATYSRNSQRYRYQKGVIYTAATYTTREIHNTVQFISHENTYNCRSTQKVMSDTSTASFSLWSNL